MRGDYTYNDYEHWMREASRDAVQSHQKQYVGRFDGCSLVLDLGCGEGLFLELLEKAGIPCLGVEREPHIAERARSAGKKVEVGDALSYLRERRQGFDGIHCSHLIEHMPFEDVVELIGAAAESLSSPGRLLLVFPNPESIRMQCFGFWKDPEHVRFYHADLVRSVCQQMGLKAEVLRPRPMEEPLSPPRLEGSAKDWAELDLEETYTLFRHRMEAIRAASQPLRERAKTESTTEETGLQRFLEKLRTKLLPRGMTKRQDLLWERQQTLYEHLNALHDFADASMMKLCQWHETQAQLAEKGSKGEGLARESFNQSLGRLIQTLNSVWGVPEESAVLATKEG